MKVMKYAYGLTLLGMAVSVSAAPADKNAAANLEQRVERMERVLESQSLLQMMERIDALQMEVQQLRGQIEEQQHQMEGMKTRQRELYLDVDRRMSRLEREGGGNGSAAPADGAMISQPPLANGGTAVQPATQGLMQAPPTVEAAPASEPQQLEAERAAYQKAFDLLRELRYEQASAEFRDFLKHYPNGRYAQLAQYWLGEAAYARRDFVQAIKEYQALIDNHPRSGKLADAMLKIGYSYQELKRTSEAKQIMERLIELYPDSTEAAQARNQLRRIKQSGG